MIGSIRKGGQSEVLDKMRPVPYIRRYLDLADIRKNTVRSPAGSEIPPYGVVMVKILNLHQNFISRLNLFFFNKYGLHSLPPDWLVLRSGRMRKARTVDIATRNNWIWGEIGRIETPRAPAMGRDYKILQRSRTERRKRSGMPDAVSGRGGFSTRGLESGT